jgi:hypothetical protein
MEVLLKNVDPKDFTLLYDLAQRLGIQVEAKDEYDPEFVAKILKSKQQAAEGKITLIAVEDLWK